MKKVPSNITKLFSFTKSTVKDLKKIKPINLLFLLIAGVINAIGVTIFISPVNLYDSGISGTSILLSQVSEYSLSVFLLVLNIPLFIFGLKKQGVPFTVYAIFTVTVYAVSAWLITDVLPIDVSIASPLAGTDLLLCALFGGIISGIGSGLAVRFGGAMDGIEVLSVIFSKKIGISIGTFLMIYNCILYIICGIVIGSWILPLYSIVTYAAGSKTIDFIVEGIERAKAAIIITEKPQEICGVLSEEFECGITMMDAKGYYSDSRKSFVYIIINRFQIGKVRNIVHAEDPYAFVSIIEVADVIKGTQKIKK